MNSRHPEHQVFISDHPEPTASDHVGKFLLLVKNKKEKKNSYFNNIKVLMQVQGLAGFVCLLVVLGEVCSTDQPNL